MAIDVSTLNILISDFRALSQKDSISPDSLGILLHKIAELVSSASAEADFERLANALRAVPNTLVNITQGADDRNNVLMNITKANIALGSKESWENSIFIKQATTSRAGAMRAQQVIDLNDTRNGLATLRTEHDALAQTVGTHSTDIAAIKAKPVMPKIHAYVEGDHLKLLNHEYYINNGYVPFVFRLTQKNNRYKRSTQPDIHRGPKRRGWNVIGGHRDCVRIVNGEVQFRDVLHKYWHMAADPTDNFSALPEALLQPQKVDNEWAWVPWGDRKVDMLDKNSSGLRMLRFRFGIGFAKPYDNSFYKLHPNDLASNLAEFAIRITPPYGTITFEI